MKKDITALVKLEPCFCLSSRLYIQVDVSSNQFNLEGGKTIRDAIEENSVTRMLDVRMCQMGEDVEVGPGVGDVARDYARHVNQVKLKVEKRGSN